MCVCETWSLTLIRIRRIEMCGCSVLRGIFGPREEEVTGGWGFNIVGSFVISTLRKITLG
jgi:hypothetical protein